MTRTVVRWAKAFGHFWWDFLVGDTPELFGAMLVLVGIAFALRHDRIADVVTLPLLAAAALTASAWRGRVRAQNRSETSKPPTAESSLDRQEP
ncbi:MAG: hypothetical protein ACP5PM_01730 [Acidimicrobiales bacterium]